MKQLKLSIITLSILFVWVSCDVLDVEPMHSISADQAIETRTDLQRAVTGCYDAFQSAGYYGRNYVVIGDLAADNLKWSGTTAGYNQIDNNSILADNVIVEGVWSSIYTALTRINSVIDAVPNVEGLEEGEAEEVLAELYFLRALAHFDLARLFGPIPLRIEPATGQEESLNIPRAPLADVFAAINKDLEFAETFAAPDVVFGKASLAAVLALKARADLFYYSITNDSNLLDDAIDAATRVIDDFGLSLEEDFNRLFDGNINSESILEIEFNEQDRNRMAEYFLPNAFSGRYEFAPNESLIESFHEDDLRNAASIAFDEGTPFANKYTDIETGTDNIYVFRLAEMYLIRAEANALKEANSDQIAADLNTLLLRADLPATSTISYTALLLEIEEQRMKEFAFEGHRWFDLVRTGRALDVLENVNNINQTLFPIPQNEILSNDHPGMTQNEGY